MKNELEIICEKSKNEFPKFIVTSKTSCYNCKNLQVFYEPEKDFFGNLFRFNAECKAHKNCILCEEINTKEYLAEILKTIICSDGRYEFNNE